MDENKIALNNFWNRAADLAESIQRNIKYDGCIDNQSVLALHEFQKAAYEVSDLMSLLNISNQALPN